MNIKNLRRGLWFACVCSTMLACQATSSQSGLEAAAKKISHSAVADTVQNAELTVATWNVEHLAAANSHGCRPRTADELAQMKAYAAKIGADIVALQEVESVGAVEALFPKSQWQIFISARPNSEPYNCRGSGNTSTQQKVAFAVRKGIEVTQVKTISELGLDNPGLRHGLELQVASKIGPVALLNVHLKSGCFVDNFSRSDSKSCKMLAQQVPVLDQWVEQKELQSEPYIVLGDFNHRLSAPYNHLTRILTSAPSDAEFSFENSTKDLVGCHPYYPASIDHIWTGHLSAPNLSKQAETHLYDNMEPGAMLSDHCAVSLHIEQQALPLTNSVKWQTTSAEYRYLTKSTYQRAAQTLKALKDKPESWVVVMDIDETVLDNSAYQVNLDKTGKTYTSASWNAWVASEQATLVPGAKHFIEQVIQQGGKLGLVTNRSRTLDNHTWNNLKALGVPVSEENTCLMGRTKQDKTAMNGSSIKNDKDLRRQQVESGSASCFASTGGRHSGFPAGDILMQVGDNIEDFAGVTQEEADVEALLSQSKGRLVLLPNPMYGSW